MTGRKLFLAVAGLGILVAGFFVARSLDDNLVYYLFPNEALAERASFPDGERFRLAGNVVPGTIVSSGSTSTFEVTDGSATIAVRLEGAPPPLFGEEVRVLLPGAWEGDVFVADEAIVQHDETYVTPEDGNFEDAG
jgi:cytochrome c-type biogenesis protein CcmE